MHISFTSNLIAQGKNHTQEAYLIYACLANQSAHLRLLNKTQNTKLLFGIVISPVTLANFIRICSVARSRAIQNILLYIHTLINHIRVLFSHKVESAPGFVILDDYLNPHVDCSV